MWYTVRSKSRGENVGKAKKPPAREIKRVWKKRKSREKATRKLRIRKGSPKRVSFSYSDSSKSSIIGAVKCSKADTMFGCLMTK